jgi:hypothetical protein
VSGTSLTAGSADSTLSSGASQNLPAGQYDPSSQASFILTTVFASTISQRMVTVSGTTQTFRTIISNVSASSNTSSSMFGIPGTSTYIYYLYTYTSVSSSATGYTIMRGTVNSASEFTATSTIYRTPQGTSTTSFVPRYFTSIGKLVTTYSGAGGGDVFSPITTTGTTYKGSYGFVSTPNTQPTDSDTTLGFSSNYVLMVSGSPYAIGASGPSVLTIKIS